MDASPKCITVERIASITSQIASITSPPHAYSEFSPHAYSAWPLTSNTDPTLASDLMHIQHDLWRHIPQGIWRHAVANLQRNWSNSRRLTKFAAPLTQFATMIILISNIDLVEYRYTALLVYRPLEIFSTVASLKPRPEYWILTTADQ